MNMPSQARCSSRGIGRILLFPDTVCMAGKRRHFLRAWRKHPNVGNERTLVEVAEYLGMTHGNLSKIERGLVPYNEELLDALADLYGVEPVDLLIRDPSDPERMWSIWQQAKPGQRRQIAAVAEAIVETDAEASDRTGTEG